MATGIIMYTESDFKKITEIFRENIKELNQLILFGSYAWGSPDAESDIDLYVVTKDDYMPSSWAEKRDIVRKVSRQILPLRQKYAIDLLVHTRAMYNKFVDSGSSFSRDILNCGKKLV